MLLFAALNDYTLILNPTKEQISALLKLRAISSGSSSSTLRVDSAELYINAHHTLFHQNFQQLESNFMRPWKKKSTRRRSKRSTLCAVNLVVGGAVLTSRPMEWPEKDSSKLLLLLDLLSENCNTEKFIMFCAYLAHLDLLEQVIYKKLYVNQS